MSWSLSPLIGLILAGCFPLLRQETVPAIDGAELEGWSPGAMRVLVLPVWEREPFLVLEHGGSSSHAVLDQPLVVTQAEIPGVPERCQSRETAMVVVGNGAAIGHGTGFLGLYLLSDQGDLAWWPAWGSQWATWTHRARVGPRWADDLAAAFREERWIEREDGGPWQESPRARIRVDLDREARELAADFVLAAVRGQAEPGLETWRQVH
jgi:hypothetical protein